MRAFTSCDLPTQRDIKACEHLHPYLRMEKRVSSCHGREVNAKLMFVDASSLQVNIDHETREITRKNLSGATSACFNEAQAKTRTLMEKDSYPRFLKSASYQDMTKQATSRGISKLPHT